MFWDVLRFQRKRVNKMYTSFSFSFSFGHSACFCCSTNSLHFCSHSLTKKSPEKRGTVNKLLSSLLEFNHSYNIIPAIKFICKVFIDYVRNFFNNAFVMSICQNINIPLLQPIYWWNFLFLWMWESIQSFNTISTIELHDIFISFLWRTYPYLNGIESVLFHIVNVRENDFLVNSFSVGWRCEISHTIEIGDVRSAVIARGIFRTFIIIHDKE